MHIVKLSGRLCRDQRKLTPLREVPRPFLIVHGGGPQLDKALARLGPPQRIEGLRVTTPRAARIVAKTLDQVGDGLGATLEAMGLRVRRIRAQERRLGAKVTDTRLERVGVLDRIDPEILDHPDVDCIVVTPVGWDGAGPINVNADEAAASIASAVGARVLTLATDVSGVLDKDGTPLPTLTVAAAERLILDGTASDGMVPKLRAALATVRAGVSEVRIGQLRSTTDRSEGTAVLADLPPQIHAGKVAA